MTSRSPRAPIEYIRGSAVSSREEQARGFVGCRGEALDDAFFEPDPRVVLERLEYADYLARAPQGPVGPAPVLYRDLLHGD